ncbi:hypothetical protein [Metallosphaera javensis (ex Sakai et al. 2022)]|uniref:hypothetical protein n=1 Tax=Metallosphaera javensis (ex Sakai et al. 2022) TaxID=2775498 RepID=UPI00258EE04A|nr:MAG: hypothetical protein MjAS7_0950 [Metallosphaera javensis (ex Sakai et al. 2022)]
MGIFDSFKKGGLKNALKDVKLEDIKRERTYLELQQKKLEAERNELEKEASRLFQDSIGKSESTKRLNATKIKNIKDRMADLDSELRELNLRLGVLYKIERLKEKAEKTYTSQVWKKLIDKVDGETLERWLSNERVSDEEILGKLRDIYNAQSPDEIKEDLSQDEKEILEAMNAVEKGEKKTEEASKEVLSGKEKENS